MREFASITIIVTFCFFATDALFMDGQYRAAMWKDMNAQIVSFGRATSKFARQIVP